MRYVVSGGGTGGHVTPILHVAAAIKSLDSESEIFYIGQIGDRFADLIDDDSVEEKYSILAGKWRRYQQPLWKTLIDIPTLLKNIRDAFYVFFGYFMALGVLMKTKPNAIFAKGGYVCVPVGLAAATLRIPIITHDSDLIPGLANKIVSRWATYTAVSSEEGEYGYPEDKLKVVGVPINAKYFEKVTDKSIKKARENIGAGDNPVILVLGGSLGAKSINDAICAVAENLMNENIEVFHITGQGHEHDVAEKVAPVMKEHLYHIHGLISDPDMLLDHYVAADLVISRAGATSVAELAALGKPSIIIPGSKLADQKKNAKKLEEDEATVALTDEEITENPTMLFEAINLILKDSEKRASLSKHISQQVSGDPSKNIAKLLIELGEKGR